MPYPTPHITNITLLANVPLDATYRNSIYFASAAAQQSYFAGKAVTGLAWTECVYHREQSAIRVNAPIDACEGVNYVMFQNTAYSTKWFYAFVTDHVYINANCTELKIAIDVLQTWYFDYEILPGFIERCHQITDAIGDNIVAENLNIGEYVISFTTSPNETVFSHWCVVAFTTFDWSTWQPAAGQLDVGTSVFSGLKRTIIGEYHITRSGYNYTANWDTNPENALLALVRDHADLVDGLVALMITPAYFETHNAVSVLINKPVAGTTGLGANYLPKYIPRNNKLYTAPFTCLMVTDGAGTQKVYSFEDFNTAQYATFRMYTDRAPDQTVALIPEGYKGSNDTPGQADSLNISEMLLMTGFPQAAWISDAFKTYLAQNKANLTLSAGLAAGKVVAGAAGIVIAGAGTAATGGLAAPAAMGVAGASGGMIAGGLTEIGSLLADYMDKSKEPPRSHGQTTGYALMCVNEKAFRAYVLTPKVEYCRIIDNYFDMFGYAQNKIGRVNIHARPHWTYTKTRGAVAAPIGSGCPSGALAEIQSIYDRGVTFWANGNEVGDYSLDNSVQ